MSVNGDAGVPHLSPCDSLDRLQPPDDPDNDKHKRMDGWLDR